MKKVLSVIILIVFVFTLFSCSKEENNPPEERNPFVDARKLDRKGYYVTMTVDLEYIVQIADELDIPYRNVYCILYAVPDDENEEKFGSIIYCDDIEAAKEIEERLKEFMEEYDEYIIRGSVIRTGKTVFSGCVDVFDNMQE